MSVDLVVSLLRGGLGNTAAYLAAHVLLCLLPAFLIAGALTALVPKASVTRFLGRSTPRFVSYPAAALAGSVLAVCSCTIVPLFAGIYRKGAGLGPAMTFLFFAPAANILALVYTGGVIGADLAVARFLLSLVFGIGIGMIMALVFRRDDREHDASTDGAFTGQGGLRPASAVLIAVLVALLLSGTFKVPALTNAYAAVTVPVAGAERLQAALQAAVPFDAAKGEEGVSAQGVFLIGLLGLLGLTAHLGVERIHSGFNRWARGAAALMGLTLVAAALGIAPHADGFDVLVTGRAIAVVFWLALLVVVVRRHLTPDDLRDWLWETWRFVKQIFPLLVVGVFAVGVIRPLIRPEWVQALAGSNTVVGNLAGVVFGVFMYFPTLVEVPIARMFLDLGMHRGPLLAYLMADPELSLQSILIIAAIIGRSKAWAYVALVALFSATAGLIYGQWIDGASVATLAVRLLVFLGALALVLWQVGRRADARAAPGRRPA